SHLCRNDLRELSLVLPQGAREICEKPGSSVNRELAKRLKALVGPRHDCLDLPWCEERECFDLLTSGRIYRRKACRAHHGCRLNSGRHDCSFALTLYLTALTSEG